MYVGKYTRREIAQIYRCLAVCYASVRGGLDTIVLDPATPLQRTTQIAVILEICRSVYTIGPSLWKCTCTAKEKLLIYKSLRQRGVAYRSDHALFLLM